MCCQPVKRKVAKVKRLRKSATPTNNNTDSVDQEEHLQDEFPEPTDVKIRFLPIQIRPKLNMQNASQLSREAFADDSFLMPSELSQEVKDCCALTAAYYDALTVKTNDFNLVMEWENKDQCCSALEWSDGSILACRHVVRQPHRQLEK